MSAVGSPPPSPPRSYPLSASRSTGVEINTKEGLTHEIRQALMHDKVHSLTLRLNYKRNHNEVQDFISYLTINTSLRSLNISYSLLDANDIHEISRALSDHRALEELNLSTLEITNESVEVLVQSFANHRTLEKLDLSYNDIDADGINRLQMEFIEEIELILDGNVSSESEGYDTPVSDNERYDTLPSDDKRYDTPVSDDDRAQSNNTDDLPKLPPVHPRWANLTR